MISMLGMVIGVASLITVLAVMNGFSGELRGRILSLVTHGYIEQTAGGVSEWEALGAEVERHPDVVAVAPFISDKVIFKGKSAMRGGILTAIVPDLEKSVSRVSEAVSAGSLASLEERSFNVVMGAALGRILGVQLGDRVEVTVPRLSVTPLGVFPRSKRLTVTGFFEIGAQADTYQAYVSLETGQKLLGEKGQVDGLQVKTTDLFEAPRVMNELETELAAGLVAKDWSQTQGSLFKAVKMEKVMVSLLLLSVVAVAAFNIVSTLVMSVTEKRADIAVLRTMGARAGSIMVVFVAHGLALAVVGISLGSMLGVFLASYISTITIFIESLLGVKLFDPAVYFISELPSDLQWGDVAVIALASLLLSFVASLYPAWRAAQVAPAEVLRYE
jgi:lipoprotein-releasing system permease protein